MVKLEGCALKNFHMVHDQVLYRSAQPSAAQMQWLEGAGFKSVINLRHFHSDKDELRGTSLRGFHIIFATLWPEKRDVEEFYKIVTDSRNWPCLVHCMHGSDRTGMMCALYRCDVMDWDLNAAIREMKLPKYGHHRYFAHLPAFVKHHYKEFR